MIFKLSLLLKNLSNVLCKSLILFFKTSHFVYLVDLSNISEGIERELLIKKDCLSLRLISYNNFSFSFSINVIFDLEVEIVSFNLLDSLFNFLVK